jgi:dephospho-CoA kinase
MTAGLTGGIGSGKSLVAKVFEMLGCAVFNSDEAAKEVYFEQEVKQEVVKLLGAEAYESDRKLNKAYISGKIFSDTALLHRLNGIIHPSVKKRFLAFSENNKGKIVIKESALLFEAGLHKEVDKVILVTAKDELRIDRVMMRDGLSRQEVMLKMKSQLTQEEKIKQSDFMIRNNEEEFVITQTLEIYLKLKALA